jgi:hypothetical protein
LYFLSKIRRNEIHMYQGRQKARTFKLQSLWNILKSHHLFLEPPFNIANLSCDTNSQQSVALHVQLHILFFQNLLPTQKSSDLLFIRWKLHFCLHICSFPTSFPFARQ